MNRMDISQILQLILGGFGLIVAVVTTILVWQIGQRQNEINQQALIVSDFAEVFLMPQQVTYQNTKDGQQQIRWNLLIKNVSAYPIYLNDFTLNGVKHNVGSSAIPNQAESWYGVPIPDDIQSKSEFSILVDFEDYRGKKYQTEGFGVFDGRGWSVKSKKRIEINK